MKKSQFLAEYITAILIVRELIKLLPTAQAKHEFAKKVRPQLQRQCLDARNEAALGPFLIDKNGEFLNFVKHAILNK